MASMVDASGEREEGEIVENTEYEDISSDEEFSLRLRIEELEARNFELEQIANISGFATNPYDLNAGKGADHVGKENLQKHRSRSNEELRTPRRTHRTAMRSIRTHPVSKRKRDKSQKSTKRRKKRRPSVSSSDSGSFLDREQLDRALNRSVDSSNDVIEIPVEIPVITIDDDDNDEDEDVLKLRLEALQSKQEIKDVLPEVIASQTTPVEPDEQELRLIALKSAVVNKHEARKKRRAQECPYSPTDDLECLPVESPAVVKVDDCSMDISPLESPVIVLDNSCVEVDMEISSDTQEIPPQKIQPPAGNAIPEFIVPDVGESEDEMTLRNLLLSEMKKPPEDPESPADGNLEEDCLRSLLLSSIKKPKTPPAVSDGEEPKADALQPKGDAEKQPKDAPEKKLPEPPKKPENVPLEKIEKTTGRRSALVTDFPTFKVTPLIIKLGESESEAEELGEGEGDGKDFDVDNKSPSSLVMESPCDSPASPAAAPPPTAAAATQNEEEATAAAAAPGHVFQDKLDLFLKQARSNVEKNSPPQKTKPAKLPKTPLALSHLPMSSQLEYRRLVARMNLLEKQKKRQLQQKTLPPTKKVCQEAVGSGNDSDKTVLKTSNNIKVIVQTESTADGKTNNNDSGDMTVMVRKDEPLRKKVLMKSATSVVAGMKNGLKSPVKVGKKKPPPAPKLTGSPPKVPKEEELLEKFLKKVAKLSEEKKKKTLELYENHFAATSSTFLEGLDDLLVMVKNIQAEKIEQYRLQDELMRLQKQMRATEEALAQKKGIIQKLTPKMTSQHKDILKHRNKCVTLNKMCLKLGQMVQGTKYILPNNTKKKLMDKFKILAAETKRLKEIQSNDGAKGGSSDEAPKDVAKVNVPKDPKEKQQQVQEVATSGGQAEKTHNSYKSPLDHMNSKPTANPDAVVCPFDLMGKCEDPECRFSHLNGIGQTSRR